LKIRLILAITLFYLSVSQSIAQKYNSLVGIRLGVETAEFSAKIALDNNNYLEGTVGIVTPQPDYTVGAGAAYHRHIHLNQSQTFQFYFGAGGKAVLGDEMGLGLGPQLGLIALYKKINIGVDILPTYFFNDVLEFQPLFGVHLRWVNY
jgi:hypothetical protein